MRSRRGNRQPTISLFPFLSILSCVSGTLTLLIVGLTMGEIATPVEAAPVVDEELYVRLTGESQRMRSEVTELERLVGEAVSLAEKLERAREERERLEAEASEADERERSNAFLAAQIAELARRERELRDELERVQRELQDLERVLADLRTDREAADGAFRIDRATFRAKGLVPSFVECTRDGLTLALESGEAAIRVPYAEIQRHQAFADYLQRAKARADSTVIFLIRPGGVPAFDRAYGVVDASKARFGYMPVPGEKPVDLGAFLGDKGR